MQTRLLTRREFCLVSGSALILLSSHAARSQNLPTSGVIYGIKPDGGIYWYRHDGRGDGSGRWANGGIGRDVGNGWDMYSQVVSGGDGVVYGIKPDGGIYWYRHDGRGDGSRRWANGGIGRDVGNGWDMYSRVFGG